MILLVSDRRAGLSARARVLCLLLREGELFSAPFMHDGVAVIAADFVQRSDTFLSFRPKRAGGEVDDQREQRSTGE